MCGRFALGIPKPALEDFLQYSVPEPYQQRWNVAPGQDVLAVGSHGPEYMRWGFVPHWLKDGAKARPMINARSESVFEKPSFRDAARSSRCLIPATAYYEWKQGDGGKVPYAFRLCEKPVFYMAGIWSEWTDSRTGEVLRTVAVLTTEANSLVALVHDRMPVILSKAEAMVWTAGRLERHDVDRFFRPIDAGDMTCSPANAALNSAGVEGKHLLDPEPSPGRLPGL